MKCLLKFRKLDQRMTRCNYIDGHYYEKFHPGWGGFVEELFFYTSRYYGVTEAFLRNLTG